MGRGVTGNTSGFGPEESGFEPLRPNNTGLVVQLVRIHACHAWGREFESRPDRQHLAPSSIG